MSREIAMLGEADFELAGLRLWIHKREFPESTDYWDGNWLVTTAHCVHQGASIWVWQEPMLRTVELERWLHDMEQLYRTGKGTAHLEPIEPLLLVEMYPIDKLGHIKMVVYITPDPCLQEHRFEFDIDQSYLPAAIRQLRAILEKYPVIGAP